MNAPAKGIGLVSIVALIRKEIADAGEIGPQGEQGPKGEKGSQGPKGNTGPAGKQGPKGNNGKQGKPGKDGKDGEDGKDGIGIEDIRQDGDDTMVITMTDGETYEIELPKGENTEIRYQSAGGGGGSVDLSKYVEKPTTDDGWMVYKLGEGWALATTDLIETNPAVTFRDAKGRYKSTADVSDLTNQLKVNRFIANELDAQAETLAKEAEMRRTKDDFLQDQINNIQENGYDDTGIRDDLAQEIIDREQGDKTLQDQIDELAATEVDFGPVEDRLDDIEGVLPGNPAQPVNIGTQTLKITGSRPTGAAGEAGKMLCWKAETGGPGSPYNEIKFIVPDTSVIDMNSNQLWLKQGNRIQRWETAGGGWFTNRNVLHISGNLTEGDDLVDGQPVEMYYSDPASAFVDVISREESKADDQALQAQIDALDIPDHVDPDSFVSKTGDVMTGPLEAPSVKTSSIEQRDGWGIEVTGGLYVDNGDDPALYVMKDGRSQIELSADGSVTLWNGYTDFQETDLVTKEYVDGQIDAIPETDLSDCVSKTGGDDMQGPLDVRSQPDSDSRGTSRVNTLGVYSNSSSSYLGLGTSGTKVYVGHNDTSFATPIKVAEIQEKNNDKGIAVTGQVTLGSEGTEEGHAVTKGYVDSADRRLQAEVEELALGLETLLTQRTHGQWKYVGFSGDNIPRNEGEFALASDDLSSQDNILTVNLTDLNGMTIGLSDVEVGDYIEIVDLDEPANYVLFTCTKAPEGTGISNIEVALKDKGNNFLVGDTCEIRFFAINQESIELSELDDRYLKLTGGKLTGTLNAPRIEAQKLEGGEAMMLIEGKLANNNSAARLTLSNKTNPNAYGSLTWHGQNGEGWFAFNKDLDMSNKGLHSVGRVRLTGDKVIQEGGSNRILLDSKVVITKPTGNGAGFVVKGKTDNGGNGDLLYTYHNSTGLDAVNYAGKQDAPANLANVGYVNDAISGYVSKSGDEMSGQLIIKKPTEVALDIIGDGNESQIKFWSSGAVAIQNYTAFKDNELVTKKYVDDAVSTNQGSVKGPLLSHTERLLHTSNGTNGKQFYFWNENSAPTDAMNYFRRFKWKLPNNHYLMGMEGAGENIGYLVIQNTGGTLLYQCQVSRAVKSSGSGYIDLYLDHTTHYGSSQLAYGSYFIVSMYSCLRER